MTGTERTHRIAVIPGDGIGPEVTDVALAAVDLLAGRYGFTVRWTSYDWGSAHYRAHGTMMPADWQEELGGHDAILFGAVGAPDIPDHETLWGLLIPIRRTFDQYINLRPVRHVPGVPTPLHHPDGLDLVIVRENSEGEYSTLGGRTRTPTDEIALQDNVFTRSGIARVAAYAADLAMTRPRLFPSATKSNGIVHTMPFWDEVVAEAAAARPGLTLESMLIDALAARMVRDPAGLDVIVASNLFGDILSDLAAACAGSIGLAPSGNINPERRHPSMFEPVHGSAPDIAGRGIANPLGQVSTAAMMLDHLGENTAADRLRSAVDRTLTGGPRTPDLGGTAGTRNVAAAVLAALD